MIYMFKVRLYYLLYYFITLFFDNFRNKCIVISELDPDHSLSALGLSWQACLKKIEIKLELLTDILNRYH